MARLLDVMNKREIGVIKTNDGNSEFNARKQQNSHTSLIDFTLLFIEVYRIHSNSLEYLNISEWFSLSNKFHRMGYIYISVSITLYGPRFLTLQVKIASLPMATDWFGIIPTNSGFCERKLPEIGGRRGTRV